MYDVAIIGGGINGCGIARDAAGRGYSVYLAEMDDLASGTSSWSTKLIHGGLRYLEFYEFRLVREALKEREILWGMAPHIIQPMRFILPHHAGLRPAWLLRLGLFLYDHIGGRRNLPPTRTLSLTSDPAGQPLKPAYRRAFEYSDCCVDDARLVVLNARDAADRGADIRTRTRVLAAHRSNGQWSVTVRNARTNQTQEINARVLINAAGPWVDAVLSEVVGKTDVANVRLVQGSHIIVPSLFDHGRSYFFQNSDGRIIFAIPFHREFTLIGTTDLDYDGDPGAATITAREVEYLCNMASEYFRTPVRPDDVVWTYAGVRPLYDDGASKAQEATRDYIIKKEHGDHADSAPLINIFGGKITTYRKLAEAVCDIVEDELGSRQPRWTAGAQLPGGDFPINGIDALSEQLRQAVPALPDHAVVRIVRSYGTRAFDIFKGAENQNDLGQDFGNGLFEREVAYLIRFEWAETLDDIVWRRSKLGLKLDANSQAGLKAWLEQNAGRLAATPG